MQARRFVFALSLTALLTAGWLAAPAADAKPTECSCDLCFAAPYYATCTNPWNGEVVGCLEFLIDFCPVGGPSETGLAEPVETAHKAPIDPELEVQSCTVFNADRWDASGS